MPTINIELDGINCGIARRILEAGVKQALETLSEGLAVSYTCSRNATDYTGGYMAFGEVSSHTPVMTLVAGLYILCTLALLSALCYLYRRGASTRDFFYWGALALIVPFIGPIVTMIMYRFSARNDG